MRDGGGGADSQNTQTPASSSSSSATTMAASAHTHSSTFPGGACGEVDECDVCLSRGWSLTEHLTRLGDKMMD